MLKAQWTVTAEIIPGYPIEELTRCWQYTSEHQEMDNLAKFYEASVFERFKSEAAQYALELQDPSRVNVVTLKFMWM